MTFPALTKVQSLGKYRLYVSFSDGVEGEVDLKHLASQGVFKIWDEQDIFDKVYMDPDTKAIAWNDQIDLCPDTFYLDLRKITFQDWKQQTNSYAYH